MHSDPRVSGDQVRENKSMETERRGFVRVEDIFPVVIRKIDRNPNALKARVFSGVSNTPFLEEDLDDSINPLLWKMLVEIHAKVKVIFDKLVVESEGLTDAHNKPVSLSAGNVSFIAPEAHDEGDLVELKMLLPTSPPCGVVLYGNVSRVEPQGPGEWAVAVTFLDMDEEVRRAVDRYIFRRQREIIAQKRDED
jgi:hypothetical protein